VPLFIGLLKGAIIGGGLGAGYFFLRLGPGGFFSYLLYGLIGALVGFVAGKPFWKHETIWTPVFKAVFGAGVGIGLYALVVHALGDPALSFIGRGVTATSYPFLLGGVVGVIYAVFIEWDDSREDKPGEDKPGQ
jgi:hypothetical protein